MIDIILLLVANLLRQPYLFKMLQSHDLLYTEIAGLYVIGLISETSIRETIGFLEKFW